MMRDAHGFLLTRKKVRSNPSRRLICALLTSSLLVACSSQPNSSNPPTATERLQKIPAGDLTNDANVRQTKSWPNPYLVIRADRVGLLTGVTANEERILKPAEVLDVLAQLPSSAWPHGRVVAILVDEKSTSSEPEKIAIRRNRGIVAGELQGAQVAIRWLSTP
jgi:hypothetical protein